MSTFSEDSTRRQVFLGPAGEASVEDRIELDIFEWTKGEVQSQRHRLWNVAELQRRPVCDLRVVFAPLDLQLYDQQGAPQTRALVALFDHFSVPTVFISERLQSVSTSFGSREDGQGGETSWFHFLCKNIEVADERDEQGNTVSKVVSTNVRSPAGALSQADYSWIRSSYVLKSETRLKQKTIDSEATLVQDKSPSTCVTLLCFGASVYLKGRFQRLSESRSWQDVLEDPYVLFDIIADELYLQLDEIAWRASKVFGSLEGKVLSISNADKTTQQISNAAQKIDFTGMHNVAKHILYLQEASEAALLTMDNMIIQHRHARDMHSSRLRSGTHNNLKYRKMMFQSTSMRVSSMNKRMQNILNLAFNLVTQSDSRVMREDSHSMKTIAMVGLVFIPPATIAAMFSSTFFNLSSDNGTVAWTVSPLFWIFWVISIPLTSVVILMRKWEVERPRRCL